MFALPKCTAWSKATSKVNKWYTLGGWLDGRGALPPWGTCSKPCSLRTPQVNSAFWSVCFPPENVIMPFGLARCDSIAQWKTSLAKKYILRSNVTQALAQTRNQQQASWKNLGVWWGPFFAVYRDKAHSIQSKPDGDGCFHLASTGTCFVVRMRRGPQSWKLAPVVSMRVMSKKQPRKGISLLVKSAAWHGTIQLIVKRGNANCEMGKR